MTRKKKKKIMMIEDCQQTLDAALSQAMPLVLMLEAFYNLKSKTQIGTSL